MVRVKGFNRTTVQGFSSKQVLDTCNVDARVRFSFIISVPEKHELEKSLYIKI